MSHDHIAIPKFIERGFSKEEKCFCYDLLRNKVFQTNISELGVKSNYYDYDVEKGILANGVEAEFSKLYKDFCESSDMNEMITIVNNNIELIEQFFSFMLNRAKKTLINVNGEKITKRIFGDLNHSELLRLESIINTNYSNIIENHKIYPLINFSSKNFISNSLGIGTVGDGNGNYSFVIPLNTKAGLFISNIEDIRTNDCLLIEPTCNAKVDNINKGICIFEVEMGNGFIFGKEKNEIEEYRDYIKNLNSK